MKLLMKHLPLWAPKPQRMPKVVQNRLYEIFRFNTGIEMTVAYKQRVLEAVGTERTVVA